MLLVTSCASTKTEYKTVYVYPQLYIPDAPKLKTAPIILFDYNNKVIKDVSAIEKKDIQLAAVPYWWLEQLSDYILDVNKAQAEYKTFINNLE